MPSQSTLHLLRDIIVTSIDKIDAHLADASATFPSLKEPYDATSSVEILLRHPEITSATSHIIAAASQLIATVRQPSQCVIDYALSFHLGSCTRAILETDTVEILKEAGPNGMHVSEIAARTNTDPLKMTRILRLLSNHYIFNELSPDVFSTNRLASVLDSGKSTQELLDRPKEKLTGASGISAYVLNCTDLGMKSSAYMPEAFTDPALCNSTQPNEAPRNLAFGNDKDLFSWFDEEENEARQKRFFLAIAGTTKLEPHDSILSGFDWKSLPKGGTVVDVGGGMGSSSLIIAKAIPDLNIIVQDRAKVIESAKKYWTREYPDAISNGRVSLQVHDFFKPQPVRNAEAFLLRFITHDWADPLVKQILRHLRDSATPETKLISVDVIIPYNCAAKITDEIPGAAVSPVPEPLLPTLGIVNNMRYWMDMQMYVLCNSQARTLGHFVHIAADSGWKVVQVHQIPGSAFAQYVSVPI